MPWKSWKQKTKHLKRTWYINFLHGISTTTATSCGETWTKHTTAVTVLWNSFLQHIWQQQLKFNSKSSTFTFLCLVDDFRVKDMNTFSTASSLSVWTLVLFLDFQYLTFPNFRYELCNTVFQNELNSSYLCNDGRFPLVIFWKCYLRSWDHEIIC